MLCMCVKYLSSVGVCLKAPLSVFYYNMDERERRCRCLARQTSERDNTGRPRAGRGQPAGFSQGFARWFAQADRTPQVRLSGRPLSPHSGLIRRETPTVAPHSTLGVRLPCVRCAMCVYIWVCGYVGLQL